MTAATAPRAAVARRARQSWLTRLCALTTQMAELMWITDDYTTYPGSVVTVRGLLKPSREAATAAEVRRGFTDSVEQLLAVLDAAGARHLKHPDMDIRGRACRPHAGEGFCELTCEVTFCFELDQP